MLNERIQEILEFTKSESPYKKANKGWINQDLFLDLNPSPDSFSSKSETAKVTLFWSPIDKLLSNIFIILVISSLLVFISLSFVKGRLNLKIFNNTLNTDTIKVEDKKILESNPSIDLDSINSENETNQIKTNDITLSDDTKIILDQENITYPTDKENNSIKDKKNNIDVQIQENKKPKSNFI